MAHDERPPATPVSPGVTVAPVPDFVDFAPLEIPAAANPDFVVEGLSVLLEDSQADLTGPVPREFWRRADLVTDVSGVQHAARFAVEFDPAHDSIEIHHIRIHRGGAILERGGDPEAYEVLRRERNLEMRRFDGRLTVHLEIPDVRVGDVVETAWTHTGEAMAVKGRHTAWRMFEWSPAGQVETRYRILAPRDRPLVWRTIGGEPPDFAETEREGLLDRRWRVRERRGKRTEPLAPPWTPQLCRLQVSEWASWAEVAQRFTAYYEDAGPLPEDLEAKISQIAQMAAPAERAAALLRFVQSDVRYLATSMGAGGLIPRQIAAIWEMRYGDCKDVTKLYVHLAGRLGLDACPALVRADVSGEGVRELLPSPGAFDHALIRLRIDGRTYWLDATLPPQPSPLDTLSQQRFGWALPLTRGTQDLEHMGQEPMLTLCDAEEIMTLPPKLGEPATIEWTITSRGSSAESLRADIARNGEVGHFRQREEQVAGIWAQAKLDHYSVSDDVAANAVTVRQRYTIPGGWEELDDGRASFGTVDTVIGRFFAPLDPGPVHLPIYLGGVGHWRRTVTVRMPVDWLAPGFTQTIVDPAASVHVALINEAPRVMRLEHEVKVRESVMPASAADVYRDMVRELRTADVSFVTDVRKGVIQPPMKRNGGRGWGWIWWVWLFLLTLGFGVRAISG